jgi:hypothetical protein
LIGSGLTTPGFVNPGVSTGVNLTDGPFTQGQATPGGTAFNLFARINADGSGILQPAIGAPAATVNRTLTVTYTVNQDCTGTMRLVDAAGNTRNVSFVIVNERIADGPQPFGPQRGRSQEALRFAFSDNGVIGGGAALAF